ncbi:hypothetical protein DL95DRAFT_505794 [Leptodontidium sp. 2 PMI_412]|nr:hypothetical protein DL95DRAFT_505794 [Leptodontidium sp. 2 PMI_412]
MESNGLLNLSGTVSLRIWDTVKDIGPLICMLPSECEVELLSEQRLLHEDSKFVENIPDTSPLFDNLHDDLCYAILEDSHRTQPIAPCCKGVSDKSLPISTDSLRDWTSHSSEGVCRAYTTFGGGSGIAPMVAQCGDMICSIGELKTEMLLFVRRAKAKTLELLVKE